MRQVKELENKNMMEEIPDDSSRQYQNKQEKKRHKKKSWSHWQKEAAFCILSFMVSLLLIKSAFTSIKKTYYDSKEDSMQTVYNSIYENRYQAAEAKTHVSNDITIRIEDIQEKAELEVLHVSDVEYVVVNKEDHPENITSWLEVPGTGIFTVDLSGGEYIVDSKHQYVCVRVPQPRLAQFNVDYGDVKQLLWKNDIFNESIKVGEHQMEKQITEGEMRLKQYLTSNRMIHENALNSAKIRIENFVKQLNPDVTDLTVEVEFVENI